MGYPWWWTAVGVGLLLVAAAVVVLVLWRTRASAQERAAEAAAQPSPAGPPDPYGRLRAEYGRRLDVVAQRYRAGELDARACTSRCRRSCAGSRRGAPGRTRRR
ncbi:hypothetical protein BJF88_08680 [Cellulosimicrobium sp. CUA-896]|nr:hypothetical protein BJF88_08680 [Cellulosimicrobium sp. CUA-896]